MIIRLKTGDIFDTSLPRCLQNFTSNDSLREVMKIEKMILKKQIKR